MNFIRISEAAVKMMLKEFETYSSPDKEKNSFGQVQTILGSPEKTSY
jgi:hypothetical protein